MNEDSNEHFALDMISEGVLIVDEDGSPLYSNEAFRTMMQTSGLTPDDLGLDLLENGDSFLKTFAEVMQGGINKDTRVTFSSPAGRFSVYLKIALRKPSTIVCIWKDLQQLFHSTKNGESEMVTVPPRDLSDYQKLFYQLFPFKVSGVELDVEKRDLLVVWQSEDMRRTIAPRFDQAKTPFWLSESGFDAKDLNYYVSQYITMVKQHPEPFTVLTPPYIMEHINVEEGDAAREGLTFPFHTKAKLAGYAPSGRPLIIAWNEFMSPERLRNIDHTQTYDELLYRFSVLQRFFNSAPLAMGLVELIGEGPDTIHLFANQCAASYCGKTPETLKGARGSTFCDKTFLKTFFEHYKLAQSTGQIVSFENTYRTAVLHNYVAHIDGPRFMYVSKDITEEKAKEAKLRQNRDELERAVSERTKQLEEAMQVKSRFLACMSHEIRTPLSGIMGAMNLLGGTTLNAEQTELLRVANVCGEQLLVVINDILDLTRMEYNKVLLETLPFSMHDALDDALEIVAGHAEKKNLELICEIVEVPEMLVGDKLRLRQILVNLLSNAVKFTHTGEVILSARGEDIGDKCKVTISVKDSGIGIPESVQKRLLQPFSQGDNSTTRRYGGSGLGLYICKKICELMGGSLWLESTVGCGSTFHFTVTFDKMLSRESSSGSLLTQALAGRAATTAAAALIGGTTSASIIKDTGSATSVNGGTGTVTPVEGVAPAKGSEGSTLSAAGVTSPRAASSSTADASSPAHGTPPMSGHSSQFPTPRGQQAGGASGPAPGRTQSESFPQSTASASATLIQSRAAAFPKRNSAASLAFSPESSIEHSRSKVVPMLQIASTPVKRVLLVNENTTLMKVIGKALKPLGYHVKMYKQVADCLRSESCKPSETTFIVAVVDARLSHIERLNELHKDVRKIIMGYHQPETITDPNILFVRKPIRQRALQHLLAQLFEERERAQRKNDNERKNKTESEVGQLRERASSVPVLLSSTAASSLLPHRLNESISASITTTTTTTTTMTTTTSASAGHGVTHAAHQHLRNSHGGHTVSTTSSLVTSSVGGGLAHVMSSNAFTSPAITPESSSTHLNLQVMTGTSSPPALSPLTEKNVPLLLSSPTNHCNNPLPNSTSVSALLPSSASPPARQTTPPTLSSSGSASSLPIGSPAAPFSMTGPRILVAEDNNMNQLILKRMLNTLGYLNVKIVSNGKEAVDAVRSERFELVLMDIMMPEMGGLEAAEIIRANNAITDQPRIVAVTANAFAEDRVKCLQAGMDEVITKPIRQNELADVMRIYVKS